MKIYSTWRNGISCFVIKSFFIAILFIALPTLLFSFLGKDGVSVTTYVVLWGIFLLFIVQGVWQSAGIEAERISNKALWQGEKSIKASEIEKIEYSTLLRQFVFHRKNKNSALAIELCVFNHHNRVKLSNEIEGFAQKHDIKIKHRLWPTHRNTE